MFAKFANWTQMHGDPLAVAIGPVENPVLVFLIIMTIMLVAPLLFERVRLPGIIGLILAGLVVGPYGLGILQRDDTIILLGTVGLLFLMFMAGLETSLEDLKLNAGKASIFGALTFLLPMLIGTGAMLALGYNFLAAVLVASCFASHTLIGLPIVSKLGLMRLQTVTATLGATLITNVLALLVLAVVVRAHQGELTLQFWLTLIPLLTLYTFATLWGVPKLGGWFFQRFGHDEGAEFTFVIATLFVVAYGAELIGIEPVVGAFLAGTAITPIIPQLSPLMNRIQFIGNTLFVPFFLISVGMLINPGILLGEPRSLLVGGVMIGAEVVSKFGAAWIPAQLFGWRFSSTMVMFGLSMAQAAATLAAITVAFEVELVDELTVNGTIAMILVTCVASPWIVARWGEQMQPTEVLAESTELPKPRWGSRVLVPVANPDTENNLLRLALILAKKEGGTLLPLHVLVDRTGISPGALSQQEQLLAFAEAFAHSALTQVEPIRRVDDSIDKGIVRSAAERQASLVVLGWKGYSTYAENFFGSVIDAVVRQAGIPVLITRFPVAIEMTRRILLAAAEPEVSARSLQETVGLAQTLANELKAGLQVLLVQTRPGGERAVPKPKLDETDFPNLPIQRVQGGVVAEVLKALQPGDLLMLIPSEGRNPSRLGREPEIIARNRPTLSMIVVHVPRDPAHRVPTEQSWY
ncbi:cation:proton antiporter [Thermostichus vulcanus]|uniref:Cation:proton antiporter n=1 Tax=Thermostichus vulcanus str. 'Rupite' TaxID=2813851 RepID=A0ABT0C7R3_THEVL|nr:cation:proton antiporter [Thermostichus vulcanus]MCJ2541752.1 cation:proton antiporter [Thermostichus vulcanus str. 'Rupite']